MKRDWLLKRNCSLTPRQLAKAYLLLCCGSFGIAVAFALQGLWIVFAFALVEMTAVGAALLHYARHALDREHIALTDRCLLVERVLGERIEQVRLDPHWTRITMPASRRDLIELESKGTRVEVGAFVTDEQRQRVARELRRELRGASFLA
ncbi:MAG: DUF2244 domain-containing protein [Ramlibacter sp.]